MTNQELYKLCQQYGAEARQWKNKFVSLLPEVYKRRLYRKRGFCSIHEFAAKLGGVSRNVVDEVLRLDEKFKEMPSMRALIPEVGLSKLRIVSNKVNKDSEKFWSEKVRDMTRGALSAYIKEIYPGIDTTDNPNLSLLNEQNGDSINQHLKTQNIDTSIGRSTFSMQLSDKAVLNLRLMKQKLEKEKGEPLSWNEVINGIAKQVLIEEPKRKYKERESKSRAVPARKRREQSKKCVVTGCNMPADVVHHVDRWALTKSHKNLKALCKAHHELAHRGYIDEDDTYEVMNKPRINPIKAAIDNKMLAHLEGT
jgi:hypothetical protein